jgi:predicted TIM-barrel fold metal-dependent hydrolase
MAETQLFETPTEQGQSIALVDSDIHPMPSSTEELTAYLSKEARSHAERLGYFDGRPLAASWGRHYAWGGGLRADAQPVDGESPLDRVRRQVLDEYGTEFGILNFLNPFERSGPDLSSEGARAVNDWLTELWLEPEPRLLGSMIVPWEWPELAVREIERRVKDGHWAQILAPGEAIEPLGSPKYWPIYEAATAYGLPVATHIGFFDPHHGTGWPSFTFEHHLCFSLSARRQLLNCVCEGLFDGVPGVRLVMVEGGVSWAASLRWALDSAFELLGDEVRLERRPSEYLDESVWFTTQPIEEPDDPSEFAAAIDHAHLADRLLFSSDYPHWDFDSPAQALPRSLPDATRKRIFAGNACELYGLPR